MSDNNKFMPEISEFPKFLTLCDHAHLDNSGCHKRVKFGRIKIRTYLLQRFHTNFGHFDNNFCYKINKTNHDFINEIADCCSI